MWPRLPSMNRIAPVECSTCEICIVPRVWLKLGKSRMNPVMLTRMPSTIAPPQNQIFSPALYLHEGVSCPENNPPKRLIQSQSPGWGKLSRTKLANSKMMQTANSGPTKLCRFLARIASHENSVYPNTGSSTVFPNSMIRPEIASVEKVIAVDQWIRRSSQVKRWILRPVGG